MDDEKWLGNWDWHLLQNCRSPYVQWMGSYKIGCFHTLNIFNGVLRFWCWFLVSLGVWGFFFGVSGVFFWCAFCSCFLIARWTLIKIILFKTCLQAANYLRSDPKYCIHVSQHHFSWKRKALFNQEGSAAMWCQELYLSFTFLWNCIKQIKVTNPEQGNFCKIKTAFSNQYQVPHTGKLSQFPSVTNSKTSWAMLANHLNSHVTKLR